MKPTLTVLIALIALVSMDSSLAAVDAASQWEEVDLVGGISTEFAVGADGTVYAVTHNNGLFLSSDHGRNWTRVSVPWGTSSPYYSIMTAISPSGRVFVGHGWSGVARSSNRGELWTTCLDSVAPSCILATPEGHVYVVGNHISGFDAIWRSGNDGDTWTEIREGILGSVTCLAQSSSGMLFAGGCRRSQDDSLVYRSTDNGESWEPTALSSESYSVHQILCTGNGYVFAVGPNVVFRSSDEGAVWKRADSGLPPINLPEPEQVVEIQQGQDGTMFAATTVGIFCSTNSGDSWERRGESLAGREIHALAVNVSGEVLAGASPEAVLLSSDIGLNWEPSNRGFSDVYVWGITAAPNGHIWAGGRVALDAGWGWYGEESFLYHSTDEGRSWSAGDSALPGSSWSSGPWASPNGSLFMNLYPYSWESPSPHPTYPSSQLLRSDTNGANWSVVATETDFAAFEPNGAILGLGYRVLKRSTDNGDTWEPLLEREYLSGVAVHPAGHIFVLQNGHVLLKSNDNGAMWDTVLVFSDGEHAESIHASSIGELFVDGASVRRSTDCGASWDSLMDVTDFTFEFSAFTSSDNGDACWGLGSSSIEEGGVFYLNAGADRPTSFDDGLPSSWVTSLTFAGTDELYAGCRYGPPGLYRRVVTPSTVTYGEEVPRTSTLHQNYPNPFNPSTTIRYGLPRRSQVHLTVFNTLGQEVATLIQGEQEAGYHEVRFDASGLSSGVYFYRLRAGAFVQTRKLLLLR